MFGVFDKGGANLRAEDNVQNDVGQGLRHSRWRLLRPFRALHIFLSMPQGGARGLAGFLARPPAAAIPFRLLAGLAWLGPLALRNPIAKMAYTPLLHQSPKRHPLRYCVGTDS